ARIDQRIERLARVAQSRRYDVMLLSDHGQASAVPYDRATGRTLAADVYRACAVKRHFAPVGPDLDRLAADLEEARVRAARVLKWGAPFGRAAALLASIRARRLARTLARRWGVPAGEIAVVSGGSIAHIYVGRRAGGSTLEEIEARFPDLLPLL